MKVTIPFKHELMLSSSIIEMINISYGHELEREGYEIKGNFKIDGEYESNIGREVFSFDIPYSSYLDDDYIVDDATITIDDFYYEIINPNRLQINIDIVVDNLTNKPVIEEEREVVENNDDYSTYKVYIVRSGDTISSIVNRYQITEDKLYEYNTINELKIGDKLIIPSA